VVVVVSVAPFDPVATEVVVEDVCPKAIELIRTVANVTLRIDLIILLSIYQVTAVIAAKGHLIQAFEEAWRIR
jgi:hypothetical protein